MKNILVLIHDDAGQEARLRVALDLVRAVDGHLVCVDVALSPSVADDYVGPGYASILVEDEVRAEEENRIRLEKRLAQEGVAFDWHNATGDVASCLSNVAQVCDIAVLNRDLGVREYPDMFDVAADVILRARLPVLAVPGNATALNFRGTVLIAWDGSRDADTALRAAVPLLTLARQVALLYVEDGSINIPIEDAQRYLARHGIGAEIRRARAFMTRPGAVIQHEIAAIGADYVVMGGFGRSRFIEAVFGGATQTLLTEASIPLLIAHHGK